MLPLHSNGVNVFIFASFQSHNFIMSRFCICSGVNMYLINFAGFSPTKLNGFTFLTT